MITIHREDMQRTLHVEVDGKFYRVIHGTTVKRVNPFHEKGNGRTEQWTVYASRGQWGERYCDPDKPTYKRVVEAVKAELAGLVSAAS